MASSRISSAQYGHRFIGGIQTHRSRPGKREDRPSLDGTRRCLRPHEVAAGWRAGVPAPVSFLEPQESRGDAHPADRSRAGAMASRQYDPSEIEPKWVARWEDEALYRASDDPADARPRFYALDMFSYPSGDLHMGHAEAFTGDRKSRRLNSSHVAISYAVVCLKKKKEKRGRRRLEQNEKNIGLPQQQTTGP